jgi:cytochrome c-type biogenesis protein CcmH
VNGWIMMLLLAALVVLGLWRWVRRDMGALQFLAATLLLALAGYAWQGRPGLAGAPKAQAQQAPRPKSDFAQLRRPLLGETDGASQWLTMADPFLESGNTAQAVKLIRDRLDTTPNDMDLWLGLADALIQHGGGMLNPAAEMAFNRAAQLGPQHPAPRFFYGLALARMGQLDQAERFWAEALAMPLVSDNWRRVVEQARQNMAEMRAMGPSGPPMQ